MRHFLITRTTTAGSGVLRPGTLIDDDERPALERAGAYMRPESDLLVAAAADRARVLIARGDDIGAETAMLSAVLRAADGFVRDGSSVPDLAALAEFDDTTVGYGFSVGVDTLLDSFTLVQGQPATPDPTRAISSRSGAGQWIRDSKPSAAWAATAEFWVDGTTGGDEAIGSADMPLATLGEAFSRVGRLPIPSGTLTIHVLASPADASAVTVDVHPTATVLVQGEEQQVPDFEGIVGTFVGTDGTSNTWTSFVDADKTFSNPLVAPMFLTVVGGPNAGATAWAFADLGGGEVRTSSWRSEFFVGAQRPTDGDAYRAFSSSLGVLFMPLRVVSGTVNLRRISTAGVTFVRGASSVGLYGCFVAAGTSFSAAFGCCFELGFPFVAVPDAPLEVIAPILLGARIGGVGDVVVYDAIGGCTSPSESFVEIATGCRLIVRSNDGGAVAGLAVYNVGINPTVSLQTNATLQCDESYVFGSGTSADGVRVRAGAKVVLSAGSALAIAVGFGSHELVIGAAGAQFANYADTLPIIATDRSGAAVIADS